MTPTVGPGKGTQRSWSLTNVHTANKRDNGRDSVLTVLREEKGGEALNSLQLPQMEDDGLMGPGGSPSSPKDNISISHEKP